MLLASRSLLLTGTGITLAKPFVLRTLSRKDMGTFFYGLVVVPLIMRLSATAAVIVVYRFRAAASVIRSGGGGGGSEKYYTILSNWVPPPRGAVAMAHMSCHFFAVI